MARSFEMDMTKGPLFKQLILYSLPIIGINLLQIAFNTVDVAVLGIFSSDQAVGAVGATGNLTKLLIGFFVGLTVSANIFVARFKGAGDKESATKFIGTAFCVGIISGLFLLFVGFFGARTFLTWMNCPSTLIDMATKYLQIYSLGIPLIILYNFSASILRAVGDSVRPLIFLSVGGVLNLVLNIFFIVVLHRDVEGVAIATISSQGFSAIMSIIVLIKGTGFAKLDIKRIKIHKKEFCEILKVGVPLGLQSSMFGISNTVMASTLNSFGETVVTANTIAHEFDAIVHDITIGFSTSTMAFISQNLGARNYKRIWKTIITSLFLVTTVGLTLGALSVLFARELCGIMTNSSKVLDYCETRLRITGVFYFLTGFYGVFSNVINSLKKSIISMMGTMFCTVVFRLFWIWCIFPLNPTLKMHYVVLPISWGLCAIVLGSIAVTMMRRNQRNYESENATKKCVKENHEKESAQENVAV